jgi:hypothetical protein
MSLGKAGCASHLLDLKADPYFGEAQLQNRRNITQNNRWEAANRGCRCRCFKTVSYCRSAKFSDSRSRRERNKLIASVRIALSKRTISQLYMVPSQAGVSPHLIDSTADRDFGEAQVLLASSGGVK